MQTNFLLFYWLPLEGIYRYAQRDDAVPGEGKLSAKQTDEVFYKAYDYINI